MRAKSLIRAVWIAATCTLVAACGSSAGVSISAGAAPAPPKASAGAIPEPTTAPSASVSFSSSAVLKDWPEFGLDPQRDDATERATGITSANVGRLSHLHVALPGTVDSSPVYEHAATVDGAAHDTIVVTTTYGKTSAIDADSGRILWTFTPPGYSKWAGSAQITNASPLIDPGRLWVYAASPDGLIHKLSLNDGLEDQTGGWPVSVTEDAAREKLGSALNIDGPDLLVATSGYIGDAPPYQGHLVAIDRATGRVASVFNTLCSNRRRLQAPSTCEASDSAILSRGGPVVEPAGRHVLVDTGNGPWNGHTDFGDSVLELSFPGLGLRQAFTPVDQEQLNKTDTDLGSSAPALLGHDRLMVAGKDGIVRVLSLSRLNGRSPANRTLLGGEVQKLPLAGGGELFTAPAVWHRAGRTTVFVGAEHATAAYVLRSGRLYEAWQNSTPGTSPVFAGGLLYVYDPSGGGIDVYRPNSPRPIARLSAEPGHWNSPIVADGHVIEPSGDANEHLATGAIEIFSAG
ncbi:MAG TPA: PQQ-binding-like beta-propeller repeat protein [Solirubrobacteraceae bacterium]|nr:PQQ-binding-like beta-propeller repeat protein [Solirubrobacteraceae bacterium]